MNWTVTSKRVYTIDCRLITAELDIRTVIRGGEKDVMPMLRLLEAQGYVCKLKVE